MSHFLLLASGVPVLRNGDVHYPFRVDSDFLAWVGIDVEGAILLEDMRTGKQVLFFDEPDMQKRLWESIHWDMARIRKSGFMGDIVPRSGLTHVLDRCE